MVSQVSLATASMIAISIVLAAPTSAQSTTVPAATTSRGQPDPQANTPNVNQAQGGVAALTDDIVVTARKRGEERLQDVPIAATAFGPQQLAAQNFHDIQSLSYSMPNVQLENIGSQKGVASFSIRGLGINSSIPSIDPTVGVFVDGIYLGITSGVILDSFDLAGVEVLRGPQGVLFGRNVTGGAVLIRTTAPGDTLAVNLHAGVESGPRYVVDGVVSGPLKEGLLSAKVAAYYAKDEGWFDQNLVGGRNLGKSETKILRGALRFTPGNLDSILRYEHGQSSGDGAVPQNHALYSRDSFDFSSAYPGYYDYNWDQLTLESNLKVGFGKGTITSITGYRHYAGITSNNVDGTFRAAGVINGNNFGPGGAFNLNTNTLQHQWSEELRYAGTFGPVDLTTGLYYFNQQLDYVESRLIQTNLAAAASQPVGGGIGDFTAAGAFASADVHASDTITFNGGLRYTSENKKADISRIRAARNIFDGQVGGDFATRSLNISDPGFDLNFHNWSPKIGVQWKPAANQLIYAFWTKGYRSGGINLRHTALGLTPRPFDQEAQTTYEIGTKLDFFDRRLRLNGAAFTNTIDNIQREQISADPVSGVQQIITNAGNARVRGFELDGSFKITNHLLLSGQAGYLDGKYKQVFVDLNGDGVINAKDYALKLPRLAPWTYGATLVHDLDLYKVGLVTTRFSWNHRDSNFFSDNNLGYFDARDIFDANITFRPNGSKLSFSLYGTNLTNQATYGSDTILPDIPQFGGDGAAGPRPLPTFSPLNRGRVIGVDARFKF